MDSTQLRRLLEAHSKMLLGTDAQRIAFLNDLAHLNPSVFISCVLGDEPEEAKQFVWGRALLNQATRDGYVLVNLRGNAGHVRFTAKEFNAVMEQMIGGRKVEAIRTVRIATGLGLKEAKDFVESL